MTHFKLHYQMKKLILNITLLFSTIMCMAQTQAIKIDGEMRRFTLYVPKSIDTLKATPLVLNFHGSGMTALEQMFYTKMNKTADQYGFIVVYPQGKSNDWNVGYDMDYDKGPNDVSFTDLLIKKIQKKFNIDANAIYAIGLSRGGFLTHRLVAELPNTFAAIATVGAPIPNEVAKRHPNQKNIAVLLVHGDADQIVHFNGKEFAYHSNNETVDFYKKHNQSKNKPITVGINPENDDTSVLIKKYEGSKTTIAIQIKNGGHTWPGADDFNIGFPLGKTTHDISFNELMWKFFSSNKKSN